MKAATILAALLSVAATACGPIPVQITKSSQEQRQEQSQSVSANQSQDQDQSSAHQSEARQGTNSMPVIIICNTVSSPNGHCIAPQADGPLQKNLNNHLKGNAK